MSTWSSHVDDEAHAVWTDIVEREQRLGQPFDEAPHVDPREILRAEEEGVDVRDRAHAMARLAQRVVGDRVAHRVGLQAEEAVDDLGVVLHPVMDFLQEDFLLRERRPQLLVHLLELAAAPEDLGFHGGLPLACLSVT
jgi:hypothetical protein